MQVCDKSGEEDEEEKDIAVMKPGRKSGFHELRQAPGGQEVLLRWTTGWFTSQKSTTDAVFAMRLLM